MQKNKMEKSKKPKKPANPNAERRSRTLMNLEGFVSNPLINKIGKESYWSFSDDDKRPLDARKYVDTGMLDLFYMDDEYDTSSLVTLSELEADKNLKYVNRAYRFHENGKRRNPLMCIDVEKIANEELVQEMMTLPMHYAEFSKSGGIHILIEVPRCIIDTEINYLFNLTVFKDLSEEFEIIFNRHFCTFTKKMIQTRTPDFSNADTPDSKQLKEFLLKIVALDEKAALIREQRKGIALKDVPIYEEENLPDHITALAELMPKDYIEYLRNISEADYEYNMSRYEYNIATRISGKLYNCIKDSTDPFLSSYLTKSPLDLDIWDYIYATYVHMKEILPHRPKHNQQREGLAWLLYLSRDASIYIHSQNKNEKK